MAKKAAGGSKSARADVKRAPKRALCVGINDYPYDGNDLNGCVNDANAWADLLVTQYGFANSDVKLMLDAEATRKDVLDALKDLLALAQPGDTLVFTNSSHGSYVAEKGGDEEKFDEIVCPYDIDKNEIRDDDLREIISGLKNGVTLAVILDNCFSGTGTRAAVDDLVPDRLRKPDERRVRFLSPALRGLPVLPNPWAVQRKAKAKNKYPESGMKEILLSGCSDKEYSYDAYFNGTYNGAMTYYAMQAIREAKYKLTYAQLHSRILSLIDEYPQTPQLEGKAANKKKQIFS
jgi:metacaspase-1